MRRISRLRFLLFFPALVALLGLLPFAGAPPMTTVSIQGQLTLAPGFQLSMEARVHGTAASLTGAGVDSPFHGTGRLVPKPGECGFPLTGTITGSAPSRVVHVSGVVTQSTDPTLVGLPISLNASEATGFISWSIGPFVLTGFGTVVINN